MKRNPTNGIFRYAHSTPDATKCRPVDLGDDLKKMGYKYRGQKRGARLLVFLYRDNKGNSVSYVPQLRRITFNAPLEHHNALRALFGRPAWDVRLATIRHNNYVHAADRVPVS